MKKNLFYAVVFYIFTAASILHSQDLSSEKIFEEANDAIVVINAIDFSGNKTVQGSGVILKDRGFIVTNFHIFAGNEKLEVMHNDSIINHSGIIGVDIEKDILILGLENGNYPLIPVGNSDEIKVGQKIYAIGSPMGLENTMSEGIISGIRKLGKLKKDYIQITASLSPGSSGGAVLNSKGELIGVSTLAYKEGQNLNFAIKINEILAVKIGEITDKLKLEALGFFFKAQELQEEGDYNESIKFYDKYLKVYPTDERGFNFRGQAYFDKKDYEKAVKDYNSALKIKSDYTAAVINRADVYFKMEKYDKAIKDYSRAMKLESDNLYPVFARGLSYMQEEDWEEAIDDFTRVIKKEPEYAEAYINRGLAYYWKSKYEFAVIDWKKAIKLNPEYKNTLNKMINNADLLWQYDIR
jgi:tetratricopeptide (TPR) repeat protein